MVVLILRVLIVKPIYRIYLHAIHPNLPMQVGTNTIVITISIHSAGVANLSDNVTLSNIITHFNV